METNKVNSIWLEVNGFNTHCYKAGESGPPIILIHGAGMDSATLSWNEVIRPLADQARIYAVDLPGYGQSEYRGGVVYSNNFYVQFIKAFMDELQIEKAMVMGLSLGGGIALGFTLKYPERVTALGLVSSNGMAKKWEWHFITYHFYVRTPLNRLGFVLMGKSRSFVKSIIKAGLFYKPENISDQLVEEIYQLGKSPHLGRAFETFQRSEYMGNKGLRSYFGDRMPEIRVPTLIIHGANERTVPVAHARKAHELISDSELYIIDEARHWPQKEHPEKFIQIVKSFLSQRKL